MEKQTVKKQKVFLSLEQLYLSIFAIILSLLITALIMLVSGENPINAFQALLAGALGSKTAIATTKQAYLISDVKASFISEH